MVLSFAQVSEVSHADPAAPDQPLPTPIRSDTPIPNVSIAPKSPKEPLDQVQAEVPQQMVPLPSEGAEDATRAAETRKADAYIHAFQPFSTRDVCPYSANSKLDLTLFFIYVGHISLHRCAYVLRPKQG